MIRVADLVKIYQADGSRDAVRAVDEISFNVEEGEFYTLLGPSGCGKTTTLRCIAGLERADAGTIELASTVVVSDRLFVPPYRRDIGMVFQSYAVWPHMTVYNNVAFPLQVGHDRPPKAEVRERVDKALELVGLDKYQKRMATQLSGGQQQRLSLARAIVREPKVLLLDEPLSNLDARLRERMRGELAVIQQRLGITTIYVTHDQIESLSMSDRIAVMDQGKITQEGSPEDIYHQPANEFVASFIGSTNLFLGTCSEGSDTADSRTVNVDFGSMTCPASPELHSGSKVVVAIRPENAILHTEHRASDLPDRPNVFEGTVGIGLFTGTSVEYYIDVAGTLVQAHTTSRVKLRRGDPVVVELPPDECRTFSVLDKPRVRVGSRRLSELARVEP